MSIVFRLYSLTITFSFLACGGGGAADIEAGTMPQGGSFTGVFHSPQYGEMNMIQTGDSVRGEYKKDEREGKITGTVEGDILRFEWVERKEMVANRPTETKGRGYFRYLIDKSNGDHVIKGEWGIGVQESGGGPWNAWKSKHSEPKLSSDDSESSGGEEFPEETTDEVEGEEEGADDIGDDLF